VTETNGSPNITLLNKRSVDKLHDFNYFLLLHIEWYVYTWWMSFVKAVIFLSIGATIFR